MLLITHAMPTLDRYDHPLLGRLVTPRHWSRPEWMAARVRWAADNDAFNGFDRERFERMLDGIAGLPGCLFVAAPDVVADCDATLALFDGWESAIRRSGLPVALVAQDGLTAGRVPWGRVDALFVGGSTEWKLGSDAHRLVAEAKRRGKWAHMGRVNTLRRLEYARSIGCDSVDGTSYVMFPDTYIPRALAWLESPPQLGLFDGSEAA